LEILNKKIIFQYNFRVVKSGSNRYGLPPSNKNIVYSITPDTPDKSKNIVIVAVTTIVLLRYQYSTITRNSKLQPNSWVYHLQYNTWSFKQNFTVKNMGIPPLLSKQYFTVLYSTRILLSKCPVFAHSLPRIIVVKIVDL